MEKKFQNNLVNGEITKEKIMVIGENGKKSGIMSLDDALRLAEKLGTDLVQVGDNGECAVCRIMPAGKFRFMQRQKEKKKRQTTKKQITKEIIFSPGIAQKDADVKLQHARKLLKSGYNIRLVIAMKGREIVYVDRNLSRLNEFVETLSDCSVIKTSLSAEKRTISVLLAPLL